VPLLKLLNMVIRAGVDAVIVTDMGMLHMLKQQNRKIAIHLSTGAGTFNSEMVAFAGEMGVSRIILPRHLRVDEIETLVARYPSIRFEVMILNSGCKNIDGFCTFHHGVEELKFSKWWGIPKKLNLDRVLLDALRKMPKALGRRIKVDLTGVDSACLLNYRVECEPPDGISEAGDSAAENLASAFNLIYGADTCGACRMLEFSKIGVHGIKVVGRNHTLEKKIRDVRFLKTVRDTLLPQELSITDFQNQTRTLFREQFKMCCRELCYYPDGMSS